MTSLFTQQISHYCVIQDFKLLQTMLCMLTISILLLLCSTKQTFCFRITNNSGNNVLLLLVITAASETSDYRNLCKISLLKPDFQQTFYYLNYQVIARNLTKSYFSSLSIFTLEGIKLKVDRYCG